jgi:hypothetical protein
MWRSFFIARNSICRTRSRVTLRARTDLFKRSRTAVIESEAESNDVALARSQPSENRLDFLIFDEFLGDLYGRRHVRIRHEVAE